VLQPAAPIGQGAHGRGAALAVQRARHAQAQQHALHGLQQRQIALRKAHADAFFATALHRTIGIEQAAQQAAGEGRRLPLHRGRDGFAARRHAQAMRQAAQRGAFQARFSARRDGALKAREIGTV
jgi:hypothetical protein